MNCSLFDVSILSNSVYYIENVKLKRIIQIMRVLEKTGETAMSWDSLDGILEDWGRVWKMGGIWKSVFVIGCIRWQVSGVWSLQCEGVSGHRSVCLRAHLGWGPVERKHWEECILLISPNFEDFISGTRGYENRGLTVIKRRRYWRWDR